MTTEQQEVPFGKLSRAAKLDLMAAWIDGKPIEAFFGGPQWHPVSPPSWANDLCYRVRAVPPSIDWSVVAPQYRWLAIDEDGTAHLYDRKPTARYGREWAFADEGKYTKASGFASLQLGTLPWVESLVERPADI